MSKEDAYLSLSLSFSPSSATDCASTHLLGSLMFPVFLVNEISSQPICTYTSYGEGTERKASDKLFLSAGQEQHWTAASSIHTEGDQGRKRENVYECQRIGCLENEGIIILVNSSPRLLKSKRENIEMSFLLFLSLLFRHSFFSSPSFSFDSFTVLLTRFLFCHHQHLKRGKGNKGLFCTRSQALHPTVCSPSLFLPVAPVLLLCDSMSLS